MPKTGHFVLHSNVMPPITAGRYELVTERPACRSTSSPSTRTSTSPRRATRCRPSRSCRAFRRPTPKARSATGCRRSCSSAARCRGSATPPAAADVAGRPGSRSSWWPKARPSCPPPRRWPVRDRRARRCSTPQDKDVEQGVYLAVTETVVKKIFPCQRGPAAAHARARGRRQRHRARERRRRRLARRGAGEPAAGVRHGQRQAGALHGLPRQRRRASSPRCRRRSRRCRCSRWSWRRTGACSRWSTLRRADVRRDGRHGPARRRCALPAPAAC